MLGMEATDDERNIDEPVKTLSQVVDGHCGGFPSLAEASLMLQRKGHASHEASDNDNQRNLRCHNGASKVDQVKETFKQAAQAMTKTWTYVVNGESHKEVCNIPSLEIKDMDGRKTLLISNAAYKAMTRPFDFAAIATLAGGLGRGRLDYPFIFETLKRQWMHIPSVQFTTVGKGNFLIRTQTEQELLEILRPGTWKVGGHFLTANRWSPGIEMRVATSSKVCIWIRLSNLPVFMWNERTLADIAMVMDARLVGMNPCTKRMDKHNFACILVEVPLGFVPTSEILLAFEDGKRLHPASGECLEEENSHIGAQGDSGKNQTNPNIQDTIATPPASGINAQADPEMPQKAIFAFAAEAKKSRKRRTGGVRKLQLMLPMYSIVFNLSHHDDWARILVIWNHDVIDLVHISLSPMWISCNFKDKNTRLHFFAIGVYLDTDFRSRKWQLLDLQQIIMSSEEPLDCLGDFNGVSGAVEKSGNTTAQLACKDRSGIDSLFYVDDLIMFAAYHMKSLKTIKGILQDLENCSGLKVNKDKNTIIGINSSPIEISKVARIMEWQEKINTNEHVIVVHANNEAWKDKLDKVIKGTTDRARHLLHVQRLISKLKLACHQPSMEVWSLHAMGRMESSDRMVLEAVAEFETSQIPPFSSSLCSSSSNSGQISIRSLTISTTSASKTLIYAGSHCGAIFSFVFDPSQHHTRTDTDQDPGQRLSSTKTSSSRCVRVGNSPVESVIVVAEIDRVLFLSDGFLHLVDRYLSSPVQKLMFLKGVSSVAQKLSFTDTMVSQADSVSEDGSKKAWERVGRISSRYNGFSVFTNYPQFAAIASRKLVLCEMRSAGRVSDASGAIGRVHDYGGFTVTVFREFQNFDAVTTMAWIDHSVIIGTASGYSLFSCITGQFSSIFSLPESSGPPLLKVMHRRKELLMLVDNVGIASNSLGQPVGGSMIFRHVPEALGEISMYTVVFGDGKLDIYHRRTGVLVQSIFCGERTGFSVIAEDDGGNDEFLACAMSDKGSKQKGFVGGGTWFRETRAAVCDLLVFFVVISPFVFSAPPPRDPRRRLGFRAIASGSVPSPRDPRRRPLSFLLAATVCSWKPF
ncbi:hypothetical protein EJ110_NYTH48463 [Nymphaea thermarum]|nr:hypothetical protein EJ110_NYTH48463 [Nymphaea thermarum]